ncbi:MAG: YggS family pyridoxal phosphate-dependent enzyme [Bacteroidetes bacterium]|nr:YggS family pyridoxal phosphate-dependent enzyme [Bacteroidota bacterium]
MGTVELREEISVIKARIEAAALRAGRNPSDVQLIAVTKTHPVEVVRAALAAGIKHIGENKVQEAKDKFNMWNHERTFQLHMIGHLQTNKVRQAVELFDIIHSVDSTRLAAEIDRRAYTKDRVMPILIQVNTSREKTKHGVDPDGTFEMVKKIAEMKNIQIKGLMTIGALSASAANDMDRVRSYFKVLKDLWDFIAGQHIPTVEMKMLSMGMTGDFEVAIEEGATHVRIGTALFGRRRRIPKTDLPQKPEERLET